MIKKVVSEAASLLGKRSYAARLEHLGIRRIQEIARENGKLGGRPPKKGNKQRSIGEAMCGGTSSDSQDR